MAVLNPLISSQTMFEKHAFQNETYSHQNVTGGPVLQLMVHHTPGVTTSLSSSEINCVCWLDIKTLWGDCFDGSA